MSREIDFNGIRYLIETEYAEHVCSLCCIADVENCICNEARLNECEYVSEILGPAVPSHDVISRIANLAIKWDRADEQPTETLVDYIKEHWEDE